jgi:hypothetical protein
MDQVQADVRRATRAPSAARASRRRRNRRAAVLRHRDAAAGAERERPRHDVDADVRRGAGRGDRRRRRVGHRGRFRFARRLDFRRVRARRPVAAARAKKPVYGVSNSVCGSAAYWVASNCSQLFAAPDSLTGLGRLLHGSRGRVEGARGAGREDVVRVGREIQGRGQFSSNRSATRRARTFSRSSMPAMARSRATSRKAAACRWRRCATAWARARAPARRREGRRHGRRRDDARPGDRKDAGGPARVEAIFRARRAARRARFESAASPAEPTFRRNQWRCDPRIAGADSSFFPLHRSNNMNIRSPASASGQDHRRHARNARHGRGRPRDLTADEQTKYDELNASLTAAKASIAREEALAADEAAALSSRRFPAQLRPRPAPRRASSSA